MEPLSLLLGLILSLISNVLWDMIKGATKKKSRRVLIMSGPRSNLTGIYQEPGS